jgi:His-Xaa-Ser system protein HxsD
MGAGTPRAYLSFDTNVFSLDTIKGTLYRFADQCSFDIQVSDAQITVALYVSDDIPESAIDELCSGIRNEVLDQDLRDTISRETANILTLILANAFSNTSLIEL